MEHSPLGLLNDLFKWNSQNTITLEAYLESELQLRQHLIFLSQAALLPPTPTVTPPSAPTVSPATTPVVEDTVGEEVEVKEETTVIVTPKKRRSPMNPTKTYSDCEKKHFLDVAYENNWGTTVAANKFTRIWGKGPTRRMFYWWREQFKRDHDRDKKTLNSLHERKTELSLELTKFCQNQENLLIPSLAERAKQCLEQLEIIDAEIESVLAKKQKTVCSITGEKCTHGDGIQEEAQIIRKFTTPFICEFCKMPFHRETTCLTHQKLCSTRFVNQFQSNEPTKHSKTDITPQAPPPEAYNTGLTELAEQLIARLAECAAGQFPTVI